MDHHHALADNTTARFLRGLSLLDRMLTCLEDQETLVNIAEEVEEQNILGLVSYSRGKGLAHYHVPTRLVVLEVLVIPYHVLNSRGSVFVHFVACVHLSYFPDRLLDKVLLQISEDDLVLWHRIFSLGPITFFFRVVCHNLNL